MGFMNNKVDEEMGECLAGFLWRRGGDSNPRDPFGPNGFQDRRFQPLTHPSGFDFNPEPEIQVYLRRFSVFFVKS